MLTAFLLSTVIQLLYSCVLLFGLKAIWIHMLLVLRTGENEVKRRFIIFLLLIHHITAFFFYLWGNSFNYVDLHIPLKQKQFNK